MNRSPVFFAVALLAAAAAVVPIFADAEDAFTARDVATTARPADRIHVDLRTRAGFSPQRRTAARTPA